MFSTKPEPAQVSCVNATRAWSPSDKKLEVERPAGDGHEVSPFPPSSPLCFGRSPRSPSTDQDEAETLSDQLKDLRTRLDALDAELIELLARRASIVDEIWAWKQQHGVPRLDPARETELKARLLAQAESLGLERDAVAAILDRIIGVALR